MCTVKGIVAYTSKKYPKQDLTLERLTKMVFLSDWKAALDGKKPITNINWHIVNSDPKMDENSIQEVVKFFEGKLRRSSRSFVKNMLEVVPLGPEDKLTTSEKGIVDAIIDKAVSKSDQEFSQLVHSTFPALKVAQDETVNLTSLANQYKVLRTSLPQEHDIIDLLSTTQ